MLNRPIDQVERAGRALGLQCPIVPIRESAYLFCLLDTVSWGITLGHS